MFCGGNPKFSFISLINHAQILYIQGLETTIRGRKTEICNCLVSQFLSKIIHSWQYIIFFWIIIDFFKKSVDTKVADN